MTDQSEPLENLVARRIRDQLGAGGLDRLIQAQDAVAQVIRPASIPSGAVVGTPTVIVGTGASQMQPMQSSGIGHISERRMRDAVDSISAVDPELAKAFEGRGIQETMLILAAFTALMSVVQALLTVYQIVHPQPATPIQIQQIFDNVTNYVINPTPPSAPPPPLPPGG